MDSTTFHCVKLWIEYLDDNILTDGSVYYGQKTTDKHERNIHSYGSKERFTLFQIQVKFLILL